MSDPLVTVALPVYNGGRFLEQTIRSVLAQSLRDFELMIVLDGCADDSAEIVERLRDERFVTVHKPQNEGLARALNTIHQRASAPLIARVDQDDLDEPTRLERQVKFLKAHPEVDVLGTRFDYIDERGQLAGAPKPFPLGHYRIRRDFQRYTPIGGPTCMYRLARILAAGGYREEFNYIEDVSLWLACLARGYRFANLPDVLVHYRMHEAQSSTVNRERMLSERKRAYEIHGPQIWGKRARPLEAKEPKLSRLRRKIEDWFIP
jgi:glycosyltransferase involved in cell wall biosynthesis